MILALDYDDTYTRDTALWKKFVQMAQEAGHTVVCVTMRRPSECDDVKMTLPAGVEIIATSRMAKWPFVQSIGRRIDVWIDDNPYFLMEDAQ